MKDLTAGRFLIVLLCSSSKKKKTVLLIGFAQIHKADEIEDLRKVYGILE
jgi:hypothetical protein